MVVRTSFAVKPRLRCRCGIVGLMWIIVAVVVVVVLIFTRFATTEMIAMATKRGRRRLAVISMVITRQTMMNVVIAKLQVM